jgi:hypothetical protein
MNDDLVLEWSKALAGRVLNDSGLAPEAQVERAYRFVHHRAPNTDERTAILDFLGKQTALLRDHAAAQGKLHLPASLPEGMEPAQAAAVVDLCHALLNSNEFVYLN